MSQLRFMGLVGGVLLLSLSCRKSPTQAPERTERPISRYQRNQGKDRVVVFVHGIFGNAKDTWTCDSGPTYWPSLLLGDTAFDSSDIYVVAYDSPYWGNRMTIDEVVSSMNERLRSDRVFSHREVVFVAHSLGGLVVQRLLLTHRDYARQVPFIYFYATPEEGSQLAALGALFSADPLLRQMFSGDMNGYLLNLENEWISSGFTTKRYCAYETKPIKGVMVVSRLSGTRNCTAQPPVPINEDHVGIVKPCSDHAEAYIILRNAVNANPVAPPPAVPAAYSNVRRDIGAYREVGCNGNSKDDDLQIAAPLDPAREESVVSATVSLDKSDNIKGQQGPTLVSLAGNTAHIKYYFEGLDAKPFSGCPGGGHATITAHFVIRQRD